MAVFGYQNLGFGAGADDVVAPYTAVPITIRGFPIGLWKYIDQSAPSHNISFWVKIDSVKTPYSQNVIFAMGEIGSFPNNTPRYEFTANGASGGTTINSTTKSFSTYTLKIVYNRESGSNINMTELTSTTGALSGSTWHHVMLSWNGTTPKLYIDGSLNSHTANSGEWFNDSSFTNPTSLGDTHGGKRSDSSGNFALDGCIADVYFDENYYGNTNNFRDSTTGKPIAAPSPSGNYIYIKARRTGLSGINAIGWNNYGSDGGFTSGEVFTTDDCADSPSD